jgi:hypothetical protein
VRIGVVAGESSDGEIVTVLLISPRLPSPPRVVVQQPKLRRWLIS